MSGTTMDDCSYNNGNGNLSSDEAVPKVKFLCSFGGSILPRPQDGRLRYVGGETRIVSVARDIGYEELMSRMRELYDGGMVLKYQQPDEDLDALVSVVNDDDVMNMMEEYDKLGTTAGGGDGFTRLRIFLFSSCELDLSPHYLDGGGMDERDTERRYVDALNSSSDSPEYRRFGDSSVDEGHIAEQFFGSVNLEGSGHNQRNFEMGLPHYNLRQLAIPSLGSGQHLGPRYSEETSWSPAYYSPRCGGHHEARTFSEFPSSPSSARYRGGPFPEMPVDRMPEEASFQQVQGQVPFDQQQQYAADKVMWVPSGAVPVDRSGFPGNILNAPSVGNGPNVCDSCKMTYQRNQCSSELHWKPEEHRQVEQPVLGNGFSHLANPCVQCLPNREVMLNQESNLQHSIYNKEQIDPRSLYAETPTSERAWIMQNQLRTGEHRVQVSGVGRLGDHYAMDTTGSHVPLGPSNLSDGNLAPTTYGVPEDPRQIQPGAELAGEGFHGQVVPGTYVQLPPQEQVARIGSVPHVYGTEIPHQVAHDHSAAQSMWRNAPPPVHVPSVYDSSNLHTRNCSPSVGIPRGAVEVSPRVVVGVDQSPWLEGSQRGMGTDGSAMAEYPYTHYQQLSPGAPFQEIQSRFSQGPYQSNTVYAPPPPPHESLRPLELLSVPVNNGLRSASARGCSPLHRNDNGNMEVSLDETRVHCGRNESTRMRELRQEDVNGGQPQTENRAAETSATGLRSAFFNSNGVKDGESEDQFQQGRMSLVKDADLTFLPELIASAKKAKLESAEVVKARAQEDCGAVISRDASARVANADEIESPDVNGHSEGGSGNEHSDVNKIEPTKAEEEAIEKGLQTIRNADLEEIRELGSGTYGAVFHGKWKGSDVAIKRIKASCFAGRPSERERLIADFWKEALILSSLHHPNVVSFYGIVRDGPDGSLATITEFMVNGSLKQYLRKKDRTIDRRKRLIIAMDAAFGMEYLHGKNIVHFDLKCENLLVNMRDPHRPVCKIGDLGLSKVKQHTLVSGGVRGTLPWMAPELLSGKSSMVTEKIDVYSFGIVMWELLTGEEPYSEMHCASIIGGIVNNTLRPQIPTWCDPEWKSLMESCWASDPAERPSFSEISQKLRSMAAAMNVK